MSLVHPLPTTPNPTPQSFSETRLGRLPRELRNHIFTELVVTTIPVKTKSAHQVYRNYKAGDNIEDSRFMEEHTFVDWKASNLDILTTCRQVYEEAHPIFFESLSIRFPDPEIFLRFLQSPNSQLRGKVQWLYLDGPASGVGHTGVTDYHSFWERIWQISIDKILAKAMDILPTLPDLEMISISFIYVVDLHLKICRELPSVEQHSVFRTSGNIEWKTTANGTPVFEMKKETEEHFDGIEYLLIGKDDAHNIAFPLRTLFWRQRKCHAFGILACD